MMTDDVYLALCDAVRLVRNRQLQKVSELRGALLQCGHSEQTVNEAIQTWANYEKAKRLE